MDRRAFFRTAALAAVAAPALPGILERVTAAKLVVLDESHLFMRSADRPVIEAWFSTSNLARHHTPEYRAVLDDIMAGRPPNFG